MVTFDISLYYFLGRLQDLFRYFLAVVLVELQRSFESFYSLYFNLFLSFISNLTPSIIKGGCVELLPFFVHLVYQVIYRGELELVGGRLVVVLAVLDLNFTIFPLSYLGVLIFSCLLVLL